MNVQYNQYIFKKTKAESSNGSKIKKKKYDYFSFYLGFIMWVKKHIVNSICRYMVNL